MGRALTATLAVVLFFDLGSLVFGLDQPQILEPRAGLVITESVSMKPGVYRLPAPGETPLITVRGTGITVDFQGAVLEGADPDADPDSYAGTAVFVDGGSNVTIRNAVIRGYKVGIRARGSPKLHLSRNDLSHNWKQRLWSGIEHESLLDWMSYHSNEKDEWLRFGAGIYLVECDGAEIDHNVVRQGQNGLMATRSSGLFVWNNTFEFNSSLGIGLYRVTTSRILHNTIDWNVRGYSHGFYNRGQDSAGLLMYEQSSDNVVAFNSVTHSGDGLFLWAGQSTMDTGKGGANGNLFYRNDFSHAPTNGIEATFSSNAFVENRVEENWHGVWGGYSFKSLFHGNRFARNDEAIAIEHGQDNLIRHNTFDGDRKAIRLWANDSQDPNWGYPKNRDTRSRNYSIHENRFKRHEVALEIDDTIDIALADNAFANVATRIVTTGLTERLNMNRAGGAMWRPTMRIVQPLRGGMGTSLARRGREHIIVDEWGPYDFRSPKVIADLLAPVPQSTNMGQVSSRPVPIRWISPDRAFPLGGLGAERIPLDRPFTLKILGPAGTWKVASVRGGTLSAQSGTVPGTVTFTPRAGEADLRVDLTYTGAAIVTPRGRRIAAGTPYVFSFARFDPPIDWNARWFVWPEAVDPVKAETHDAFRTVLDGAPVLAERLRHLDLINGRELRPGLPRERVALVAEGTVELPAGGEYVLRTISDDGIRVWIDGGLVIDAWHVHGSEIHRAPVTAGTHKIRVEYFEATGWAELRVDFVRVK